MKLPTREEAEALAKVMYAAIAEAGYPEAQMLVREFGPNDWRVGATSNFPYEVFQKAVAVCSPGDSTVTIHVHIGYGDAEPVH